MLIGKDKEIIFNSKEPLRFPDINPILGPSIWISKRTDDQFRQTIDIALTSTLPMADQCTIWYPHPRLCCSIPQSICHDVPDSL